MLSSVGPFFAKLQVIYCDMTKSRGEKCRAAMRKAAPGSMLPARPRAPLASEARTDCLQGHFPRGVAQPALRALHAAGLTRLEQLTQVLEAELSALHGMGPRAIATLRAALLDQGLDFRPEESREKLGSKE